MTQSERLYTLEEYVALDAAAEYKCEYVDGRVYAMSGGTEPHALVCWNLLGLLHAAFRGRPCRAYPSDLRVKVAETGTYTYPDLSALCGEPAFDERVVDTLLNPSVLVEVLSPSTEAYDRGEKFARYRRVPSLREYVLVAQDRPRVECYTRRGDGWVLTEASALDAAVELRSVGVTLALGEVYERVAFPDRPPSLRPVREPEAVYAPS